MIKALIAYATLSGNTEEVAKLIGDALPRDFDYALHDINDPRTTVNISEYDIVFIGTYTWDYGDIPEEMREFIADNYEDISKPYVFGTGDTQFGGDDLFCAATDTLARALESPYHTLKVEQSPRGAQKSKVIEWTKGVFNDASKRIINEGTRIKSEEPE